MEQSLWQDFLLKQAPVIVVLSIFCYTMYKYLTRVIEGKDTIIKAKDERLEGLLEEHMEIQKQNIEAYGKFSNLLQSVMEEIRKSK